MAGLWFVCLVARVLGAYATMAVVEPGDSPFAGIPMRSVPFNRYLGPQGTDPAVVNVTAEFMVVNGDTLCDSGSDVLDMARGRIVFVVSSALVGCPASRKYNHLQEKGVVAWVTTFPNGYDVSDPFSFYSRNPDQPDPAHNDMVFVAVEDPAQPGISLTDYLVGTWQQHEKVVISIYPDVSDWDGFYLQWYVQVPMRWVPTIIFGASFALSAVFLYKHLQNISAEFDKRFPMHSTRTRQRRLEYVGARLGIVHLILGIELVMTLVIAVIIGVGGVQSNDILPHAVTGFFVTGLSGWGFTCDVLSAVFWTNVLKEMPGGRERDSAFGQFLERQPFAKVALCVLPVLLDTTTCLSNALDAPIPYLLQIAAALVLLMQLAVGIQFLMQALRFQRLAVKSVEQSNAFRNEAVDRLLRRLTRWTLCLSLSMIALVCFLPIGATTYMYSQIGWVTFWSGAGTMSALTSLCRVMLARPPPARVTARVVPTHDAAAPPMLR
ncbi:Uncharacterized protein PBTT_08216 [Plasmodiophora brassicae]